MLYFNNEGRIMTAYLKTDRKEIIKNLKSTGNLVTTITKEGRRGNYFDFLFQLDFDKDAIITDVSSYSTGHYYDDWEAHYNVFKPEFPRINKLINSLCHPFKDHVDLSDYLGDATIDPREMELLKKILNEDNFEFHNLENERALYDLLPKIGIIQFDQIATNNANVLRSFIVLPTKGKIKALRK